MASRVILGTVAILALVVLAQTSVGEVRTWTDATGAFTIEAELVKVEAGKAHLKKAADGEVIVVPLDRLSENDRRHVAVGQASSRKGLDGVEKEGVLDLGNGATMKMVLVPGGSS